MARSYYSTVLDHTAAEVWQVIRPFDQYAWSGVQAETVIEAGKTGDQVGAVRRITLPDKTIRQILLSHSDLERCYAYAICDPLYLPVQNYIATIRVTPVTKTDKAFVEWEATFDCASEERDRWTDYFEKEGFAKWLSALALICNQADKCIAKE
jgi:Polyketide cyclase / dehydrase and lipid transport